MVSSVCNICGTANPAQAAFCYACGKPLQQTTPPTIQASTSDGTGALAATTLVQQRYRILTQVGKGGFGAVYKAADTKLGDRVVALKEMSQSGLSTQESIEATENFKREALLLAGLTHPNLPRIYDHFFDQGHWYLVMDFIEGETLEYMLDKAGSKLPVEKVLAIGIQLCNVLNYLHTRQPPVIFRDLKPANILLTADNTLYLIDFGIARIFKPGQAKDTIAFGSPGYAAPEQYGKAQTTQRSDIYSLGATLHQMLTGDDPSDTPFSFAPLRIAAPALEQLILRMVSMDANKRPASVADIQQELQNIANGKVGMPVVGNLSVGSSRVQPVIAISAKVPKPGTTSFSFMQGELLSKYSNHTGIIHSVAWSPDGKYIASASEDKTVQVWEAATGKPLLTCSGHTDWVNSVSWSPDGMHIVSASKDKRARIWNVQSGNTILTYSGHGDIYAAAWSPDGIHIATASLDKTVQVWNATSGIQKFVYRVYEDDVRALAWSPDSARIVSGGNISWLSPLSIQIRDANTGEIIFTCSDYKNPILALAWSPDGKYIVSSSSSWGSKLLTSVWSANDGKILCTLQGHPGIIWTLAWSPDSRYIASGGSDATVQIWNPLTGDTLYTYHGHAASAWNVAPKVHTVAWSPDGRYIASGGSDNTVVQVWQAG